MFSRVFSHDANFEVITAAQAKKLVLERQNDLIGHKLLVYAIDKADKSKEPIRKVTIDFFKNLLGFNFDEVIFVDVNEFKYEDFDCRRNFSAHTQEAMTKFAKSIFQDTKHGLAKQILNIALCECDSDQDDAYRYFNEKSDFELTAQLTNKFTFENALEYFNCIAQKIKAEEITQIIFKEENDFFISDEEKGFKIEKRNTKDSGFKYRLNLPER